MLFATLGLAVVLAFLEAGSGKDATPVKWAAAGLPIAVIVALYFGASRLPEIPHMLDWPSLCAVLAVVLAVWRPNAYLAQMALGASAASAHEWNLFSEPFQRVFWVFVLAGAVSTSLVWSGCKLGALAFGLSAALASMANAWAPEGFLKFNHQAGTTFVVLAVVAGVVGWLLRMKGDEKRIAFSKWAAALTLPVGAVALSAWAGHGPKASVLILIAVVLAALTTWMLSDDANQQTKCVVAGLAWTAFATFAYSEHKAFGLALASLAGALAFVLMERPSFAALMSPLIALAFYRSFRMAYTDSTRAFDIGQHYGMVGVMLGVGAVVLVASWGSKATDRDSTKGWLAAGLAALLVTGGSLFAMMFLATKGTVGLIVGLGLGPWFTKLTGSGGKGPVAACLGLLGVIGLGHPVLVKLAEASRDTKLMAFWIAIVISGALVWGMWSLAKPAQKGEGVAS